MAAFLDCVMSIDCRLDGDMTAVAFRSAKGEDIGNDRSVGVRASPDELHRCSRQPPKTYGSQRL